MRKAPESKKVWRPLNEMAEKYGVSKDTIKRMDARGELTSKKFGRVRRYQDDADEMDDAPIVTKPDVGIEARAAITAAIDATALALTALKLANARLRESETSEAREVRRGA